jgi:hypothetical protein
LSCGCWRTRHRISAGHCQASDNQQRLQAPGLQPTEKPFKNFILSEGGGVGET